MDAPTEERYSIRSRYTVSLRCPEYRKLWSATMFAQSSAWALIVARGALVLHLTGSASWTGAVTFAAMIPSVFISPLAGYLADRFDRRKILIYTYVLNLATSLILAILVATNGIEPWHILLLSVANGCARSTQMPATQALLPNTVPRLRIINAVALYQATQNGARFSGPLLILLVLFVTGHQEWVFFLCAALYAAGLSLVLNIHTVSKGVVETGTGYSVVIRNLAAGLRYMYREPLVLSIILLVVAHCGMTMSFESLLPILSRDKLGLDGSSAVLGGFSYLMIGFGSAALVTAFIIAGIQTDRVRGRTLLWLGVFSGLTPILLALSPNLPLAVLSAAGMGASQGGFMTISHAMLQTVAPDSIRGRLMGVYSWHTQGFMASFNLVNGTLVGITIFTAPIIISAGGVAFFTVMVLSFARIHLRQVYSWGIPAAQRVEAIAAD